MKKPPGPYSILENLRACCRESCKENNYDTILIAKQIYKCQRQGRKTRELLQHRKDQLSVLGMGGNKGKARSYSPSTKPMFARGVGFFWHL